MVCRTYVEVILSGEEQFDEQIILNFDGTVDMKHCLIQKLQSKKMIHLLNIPRSLYSIDLGESNQKKYYRAGR